MVPSAPPIASTSRAPAARARVPTGTAPRAASNASNIELQNIRNALADVEGQAEGFERERDFYFESKLSYQGKS
jgi:hypothetical protein